MSQRETNDPIGNENVERLLKTYLPEEPGEEFAARLEETLLTAARARAGQGQTRRRRFARLALVAAAVIAAFGVGVYLAQGDSEIRRDGDVVWIDGQAYRASGTRDATGNVQDPQQDPQWQPVDVVPRAPVAGGSTPRPRGEPPAEETRRPGEDLRTGPGERRRVALDDGSVLYLNERSEVRLTATRRVELRAGEVVVEVAPDAAERFVVATAAGEVVALGTRFRVRQGDTGTDVLVTQGKVRVAGFDGVVTAGQQLVLGGDTPPQAAPRVSHVLDWTRELMAAAESPLVPGSDYGGGALLAVDPYGDEMKLELRKLHVDVHIEDGFARTTIDQTYFNHAHWRMEGTFYFPLPPDASLSRLAMYVNGTLMEGGMAERGHARNVYEQIVHRKKDPALLEWVDGSTFKMRVFPLEARREKRIVLSYTQKLDAFYGEAKYRFPAGHSAGIVRDWSFEARIRGRAVSHWNSPTHELESRRVGESLVLRTAASAIVPDRDVALTLYFGAETGGEPPPSRFATFVHEGQRYLMLGHRPQLESGLQRQRRDWVFLFEASADRDPLLARAQIEVLRSMLRNAEHDDTFSILTAGTQVHAYAKEARLCTPDEVEPAVAWLEETHLIGALDLGQALRAAQPFLAGVANPHLVHLGSGTAVLGERADETLRAMVPNGTRYVGVGVGKRWARNFMKSTAAATGGYFTQINPDEQVAWRSFELLATLNTPRLLDVAVVDDAEGLQFLTFADAVAGGEEVVAVARLAQGSSLPNALTLHGTLDGEPFTERIALPETKAMERGGYLPRFWAKLQIDAWVAASAEENKAQIVELSKAMYVMSPFTSLLVLENEEMYAQFNVDRGRKDHWALYPCPDEIEDIYEPEPGVAAQAADAAVEGASREQVLQSILVRLPANLLQVPQANNWYGWRALTAWQFLQGAYAVPNVSWYVRDFDVQIAQSASVVNPPRLGFPSNRDWGRLFSAEPTWDTWGAVRYGLTDSYGVVDVVRRFSPMMEGEGEQAGFYMARTENLFGAYLPTHRYRFEPLRVADVQQRLNFGLTPEFLDGELFGNQQAYFRGFSAGTTYSGLRGSLPGVDVFDLNGFGQGIAPLGRTRFSLLPDTGILSSSDFSIPLLGDLPVLGTMFTTHVRDIHIGQALDLVFENETFGYWGGAGSGGVLRWCRDSAWSADANMLYQRPTFSGDWRVFGDLLAFAPAMNTSWADLLAVLEAEAKPEPDVARGHIEPGAQALIDRARGRGWSRVTLGNEGSKSAFDVTFDGQGRFTWRRTAKTGLTEVAVYDGDSLLHLYPEIGVGARRQRSNAHARMLRGMVPWLLPDAGELARGADLQLFDAHTVAIVPHGVEPDAKHGRVHLSFADDGRLAEVRIVRMPDDQVVARVTYAADGTVTWFVRVDDVERQVAELDLRSRPSAAPDLRPDADDLVVLPMPFRTRDHVLAGRGLDDLRNWSEDDALALMGANLWNNGHENLQIAARRFLGRGDLRVGFYTLLAASHQAWNLDDALAYDGVDDRVYDPARDLPESPLAQYLSRHLRSLAQSQLSATNVEVGVPAGSFVADLIRCRTLLSAWTRGSATESEIGAALLLARETHSVPLAWTVLTHLRQLGVPAESLPALAEAYQRFVDDPAFGYPSRYERARILLELGANDKAAELFEALHGEALAAGGLPRIDAALSQAFKQSADGAERWSAFVREAASSLEQTGRRGVLVDFALQLHQLGETALAEELIGRALTGAADAERIRLTLSSVGYLWQTGQYARALNLLEPLLQDEKLRESPMLWRLGAKLAEQRGMQARALKYLESALELEYRDLPKVVNLQTVRTDYGRLLGLYQQVAQALAALEEDVPQAFVARVVRAADRWRALDDEKAQACQAAARVLQMLGAEELAWEYLTTPLAHKPNEAAPWLDMARTLRREGELVLADRAFAEAFAAEATNAGILFERAQNLAQAGRLTEARALYQKLAEGEWQPRFSGTVNQARQALGGR